MPLREPFAAYNAASNIDAYLVRDALIAAGIEAHVVEDVSQVGVWLGGQVAEIHKPQVWIEKADIERARPVLTEYDELPIARRRPPSDGSLVEVTCEECGKVSKFPDSQSGSVQTCPHCQAYVDVGEDDQIEGWDEFTGEEEQEET